MKPLLRFSLPLLFAFSAAATHAQSSTSSDKAAGPARKELFDDANGEFANFVQWKEVGEFIDQMVAKHAFNRTELESLLGKARYIERAVQLVKPAPPGQPKNWRAYRARFVEPIRIGAGVAFWDQYADALARAEEQFKVPAEIIVGIIGVETIYGRHTGNFRVLDTLTTLAFAYPDAPNRASRMAFFRGEVENTLLLARESGIDPFSLFGSYAGAVGWPQFMPGSIRAYAVDFDGDKRIDLRNSPVDAIGSVANFLVQHGWKPGEPLVFPATVTGEGANRWQELIGKGLVADYRLDELKAVGVVPGIEPPEHLLYGLADLQNGYEPTEYWIAADNFFAITKYNRSYFYAMSVIDLGRSVKAARGR
ncbi:MAG: lytic murein transglycosylase B [Burkholderiaceae bacterium]